MSNFSEIDNAMLKPLNTPYYLLEEKLLRENLRLIQKVGIEADVEIILALKAFALWKTFPIFRKYFNSTTDRKSVV